LQIENQLNLVLYLRLAAVLLLIKLPSPLQMLLTRNRPLHAAAVHNYPEKRNPR